MKIFPNFAGGLRFYFGLTRTLVILASGGWISILLLAPLLQQHVFFDQPKLMVTIGQAVLRTAPDAIHLNADTAKSGSVALSTIGGTLQADLLSQDAALVSALRWTIIPSVAITAAFGWLLLTALRAVCANIERREVLSETNLKLVRRSAMLVIAFSVVSFATRVWSSHVMSSYLGQHISVAGIALDPRLNHGAGGIQLTPTAGFLPVETGLIVGLMILLISEAFRQGLALKAENDLTV